MSETARQVLSGPFSEKDLPDYQAAVQHVRMHWRRLLSPTQLEAIEYVIDATARFGRRSRFMRQHWLLRGLPARPSSGFAGIAPITPVSRQALSKALSDLQRLGILVIESGRWAIDYSITAMHLVEDEAVQKRVLAANRRGGILSTVEGLLQWAAEMVQRYVKPQQNKAATYTFTSIDPITSSDKSSEERGFSFSKSVTDWFMGNRTASQIAADALASVDSTRRKVREKQAKRGTLADRMRAFEREWGAGQIEASGGRIPTRIDQRGKKLIKDQLLKRAAPEFDTTHFAYWVSKNWQAIGAQYFAKAKSYPEKPVVPWLIKCLETYIEAYEQREYLDEAGTRSNLSARKAIQQRDKAYDNVKTVISAKDREIERLKAQLNERDDMLDEYEKRGKVDNPDLSPTMRKALKKARNVKGRFKDFDDG